MLGRDVDDDRVIVVLGQALRWREEGVEFEGDGRHGELIKTKMGVERGSNLAVFPVVREGAGEGDIEGKLSSPESSRSRAVVARADNLETHRPDLQFVGERQLRTPRISGGLIALRAISSWSRRLWLGPGPIVRRRVLLARSSPIGPVAAAVGHVAALVC